MYSLICSIHVHIGQVLSTHTCPHYLYKMHENNNAHVSEYIY